MRTLAGGGVFGAKSRIYRGMRAIVILLLGASSLSALSGVVVDGESSQRWVNHANHPLSFMRGSEHVGIGNNPGNFNARNSVTYFGEIPVVDAPKSRKVYWMQNIRAEDDMQALRHRPIDYGRNGQIDAELDFIGPRASEIPETKSQPSIDIETRIDRVLNRRGFKQYVGTLGSLCSVFCEDGALFRGIELRSHSDTLSRHYSRLMLHDSSLSAIDANLPNEGKELQKPDNGQGPCKPRQFSLDAQLFIGCFLVIAASLAVGSYGAGIAFYWSGRLRRNRRGVCGLLLLALSGFSAGCALSSIGFGDPLAFWRFRWLLGEDEYCNESQPLHNVKIVTQKYLTSLNYRNTVIGMANVLSTDKKIAVISALAEGSSIRAIERITGVHRDTIMRLGVKVGQGCAIVLDAKMRNLPCQRLELDEIWGFVGKKEKHLRVDDDPTMGDVWTFCAVDADTKLVPAFRVGKRSTATANAFVQDVANRMANRVQISTDGLKAYVEAIEKAFGGDVNFAQIIKTYGHEESTPNRRYSAPEFVSSEKRVVTGSPDMRLVSTSYVERLNATTRLHMRRLTRLTLAFSKKLENFEAAVALHFAYYNLVKRHGTLRCTPAMAAGVESSFWTVGDLIEAAS